MLDVNLFGKNAAGLHFTNLTLHAINVVLIFWLLRCLTGAFWRSAMVAALFGWLPVHVESVAWVSERKDVLSTCFGLLSLLFYAHYVKEPGAGGREPGMERQKEAVHFIHSPYYWLAWICFALGLLSKPMLVTWPFMMLLLDYWPLAHFSPAGYGRCF